MIGSDEGRKLGISDGKLRGAILVNLNVILLGLDVGTEMGSLDVSLDSSNDVKIEILLNG